MKNSIIAIILGAVILFFWGFISWTVLPWHKAVTNQFENEAVVAKTLKANAPEAGIYWLPYNEADIAPGKTAAFANVLPDGYQLGMGEMMGMGMLGQIITAILAIWLLSMTRGLSYKERVIFLAAIGLTVGFTTNYASWVWFGFSGSYAVVMALDTLIAWTLAGLAIAKFVHGKQSLSNE